jgi:hypothetical protein
MEGRTHQGSDKGEVVIYYGCHVRKNGSSRYQRKACFNPDVSPRFEREA